MAASADAYLVIRRDDGFGDVFPLTAGQRYTIGRATTSRIALKDEVCSREHAEVFRDDGHWYLRDLNSLNGTRVNGERLSAEWALSANDEIQLGRTTLVFVDDLDQLPPLPFAPAPSESVVIKKRLGQTRFLTPIPPLPDHETKTEKSGSLRDVHRVLALLYRIALDMGSANTYPDLVKTVLRGLLEAIPADTGAILTMKEGTNFEVTEFRHRESSGQEYQKVSQYVSKEVITSREAVLAEDILLHPDLRQQKSLQEIGTTSLICAPVMFGDKLLGLIHLYCTRPGKSLDAEDLEFVMAVARQFGAAAYQLQRQASLTAENRSLRDQLRVESELVGHSGVIRLIEQQIGMVAGTHATVLIRGESGVGKELVARAIHYSSPRRDAPFVCLNCAALPESLLESELFGHEKGSFTGATDKKIGKFEAADQGTIFLDEIGEISPGTQSKLLRILEGHPFERLGGHAPIRSDVRVVAATNRPLEEALKAGTFRPDLFFRLQVVEIRVPPLRERRTDIPLLADFFLKKYVLETGRKVNGFTPSALRKMEEYHWPGNIRELRNVIERAVALGLGPVLDAGDIWLSSVDLGKNGPASATAAYEPVSLEEVERRHILQTLEFTDWNKSQAANILQIERSTLDRKIKAYELKR